MKTEVSEMKNLCLVVFLGCLCLATAATAQPPLTPYDWLSDDRALITGYGYSGYPYHGYWTWYDDRLYYDEWYPVARSFLDGTTYMSTYYYSTYPVYGSWWGNPRGYRPLYRIGAGIGMR